MFSSCTAAPKAMAAGSSSIEITVLNLGGGEIAKLTAEPEVKIKALKEELASKTGLSVLRQSLTYEDRTLEDTETCSALGWSGAVSIYMIAKSVDLDGHITCLRREEPPDEKVGLPEKEIRILCDLVEEIFMREPVLMELEPPLVVGGTLASSVEQLNKIIERCGEPGDVQYLFLGNYVSRGRGTVHGVDLLALLYCFKCRQPDKVFLLRGKQECASISRIYGFYDECKRRYNVKLWKRITQTMNCMPICALIRSRIFCVSSGLSPELRTLDQLMEITRPTEVPDHGLLCDLLWADPETGLRGWAEMDKGVSYIFGEDIVHDFMERNSLDLICRTSQVVEDGYEYFADQKLVTLFSCADYVGEFDNRAAVMLVDAEMQHTFVTYR
ncbi:sds21 [Symbiodinium sp. CCMP2592]|nr:sds21 [Symbiodinium sp. CCMP2592]